MTMKKQFPLWAKVLLWIAGVIVALVIGAYGLAFWALSGIFDAHKGSTVDQVAWTQVEVGMTSQQVVSTLGPPMEIMRLTSSRRYTGEAAWHYGWSAPAHLDEDPERPFPLAHIVLFGTNHFVVNKWLPSQIEVEQSVWRRARRIDDSAAVFRMTNGLYQIWLHKPDRVDISSLRGVPIEMISINADRIDGIEILKDMSTLQEINHKTPEDFWREHDGGPNKEMHGTSLPRRP